jgi:hypothetical protein
MMRAGNGNDGTVNGATLSEDRFGNADSTYSFDGINDFIDITPQNDVSGISDFAISIWTYLNDWKAQSGYNKDRQYAFDGHSYSSTVGSDFYRPGFCIIYDGNSDIEDLHHAIVYNDSQGWVEQNTQMLIKGRWVHTVFMRLGDKDYTYIDGQLINSTYVSGRDVKRDDLLNMQHTWFVGTFSGNNPNYNGGRFNYSFYGLIDDIRIYNRALSESAIKELYNEPNNTCTEDNTGSIDIAGSKARYGETVTVPVKIQNAPNEVSAFGFDIMYDPEILTYKDSTKGTLVQDFDYFEVYLISDGLLRCGGFTDDNAIVRAGSGNLVCLNFDVAEDAAKSKIELKALEDDISTWTASPGCFAPGCTGDVNKDGKITPQDALCAFEKYMSICPTSCNISCADICADVNYDDDVTPADALCIFNKYLGKTSCLDAGQPSCN